MAWFSDIQTHMDYEGQGRAEFWSQLIILFCTVVGAFWAYVSQQFSLAFFSHLFGLAVACILCLPPWPIYRRKPLKWQRPVNPPVIEHSDKRQSGKLTNKEPKSFLAKTYEWYFVLETRLSINLLEPWEKAVLFITCGLPYAIWIYAVPVIANFTYSHLQN